MESERSVLKVFNSPSSSKINSLPLGSKGGYSSNWYYNPSSSPTRLLHVLKKGWLERQSTKLFSSWKQKWVVLTEQGLLCYDSEKEDKSYTRVILLKDKVISEVNHGDANNGSSQKFLFQLSTRDLNSDGKAATKKVDVFCVPSEEVRKEWIRSIKKAMYAKLGGAIFGGSLEETLSYERRKDKSRLVPEIVQMCVAFLEENGLEVDGIFRLTGKKALIRKLQEKFDQGDRPPLRPHPDYDECPPPVLSSSLRPPGAPCTEDCVDVHTVASLLKLYLLELPEPIVPVDFYVELMTIVTREYDLDHDPAIIKMAAVISRLPENSYNLLRYLCQFLKKVGDKVDTNRMSNQNLAKVFCNAILQPEDDNPALLMGTADNRAKAVTIMITYLSSIFREEWKTKEGGLEIWEEEDVPEEPKRVSEVHRMIESWEKNLVNGEERRSTSDSSDRADYASITSKTSSIELSQSPMLRQFELSQSPMLRHGELSQSPMLRHFDTLEEQMIKSERRSSSSEENDVRKSNGFNFDSASVSIANFLSRFRSSKSRQKGREVTLRAEPETTANEVGPAPPAGPEEDDDENLSDILRVRKIHDQNMRRSSSVKNFATKEKESLLDKLYDDPNLPLPPVRPSTGSRNSGLDVSSGFESEEERKKKVSSLVEVDPKKLSPDDLLEHCCKLQKILIQENKRHEEQLRKDSEALRTLQKEVKDQRQAREQAVAKVVEVQSLLESYLLKFGPL